MPVLLILTIFSSLGSMQTFGNFQQKTHSGYSGGYAGQYGDYRGPYEWGNPTGQGQGSYSRR